ncbi:MAG: Do family serine endopeptidase [Chitinophagaceae bacterium]|nr:Do family serine endopeptidase [Chitinophagaceae bacterium]MCA6454290.1 Do family serine endopeptidase [Chitinophagaceae bacterium]MCA6454968.1 Do family serine endopeptidase [Chitinophagaceae bacterium]MCA6457808.1 Do family serine endopeptidase [Chitinophagaceae bacterium]MCA6463521.1 Do family serine endopeptidase [Chitinophagaceae bacterium]
MNLKNIVAVVAISASTAVMSVWGYGKFVEHQTAGIQEAGKLPVNYAGFFGTNNAPAGSIDFTPAATTATPAVVHIKTKTKAKQVSNSARQRFSNPFSDLFGDDFGDFFGGGPRIIPEQRASGSGVIITDDGYIVTNNHVVDGADDINVTLSNKKSYKATLVGTDPSSDLAVIKIEGKGLPYLVYGNSDDTKLGQWVLAIGYPLTLDVTVTAGIVSAKSRSIGINDRQSNTAIESFIQTDAAVNPGNSGGALINTNGELIGINSAIASPTGSYAGYSYAIPVNMVKKIVTDIVKFGAVQRAFIGIQYPKENLTDEQKKELGAGYKEGEGVYVTDVPSDGAAAAAGIKKGDVVTKINGKEVTTGPELQEQVTRYKPGDKISLTYLRGGKENTVTLTLKNKAGTTDIVKTTGILEKLGAELVAIDSKTAAANQINGGVLVKKIGDGLLKKTRMQEGFIITSVNDQEIKSVNELDKILSINKGRKVKIEGVYPGFESTYPYPLDLSDVD